jgi:hypothetical protein
MASKSFSQPRWQRVIKEMELIGKGAQILDLGQKLRPALIGRRRAVDVGKRQGVTIQVGNALARPLIDPKHCQEENGKAEQHAKDG